jgi:hypothetical protein
MAFLTPQPRLRFFDEEGVPLANGRVYTYAAGTTTPLATYTDQSGNTPNSNPVDLDSDGGASIWFSGSYKIDVKKLVNGSYVSLQGYPVDNVNIYDLLDWSDLTATIAELNATDTSTLSKSANYTIALPDRGKTILCDATGGGFTIALPAAAQATNGFEITIKKTDVSTNQITLDGNASETIEGRTTFLLYDQNDIVTLLCDGNNWRVKSGVIRGNTQLKSAAFSVAIDDINKTFLCSASAAYAVTLLSAVTAGDGFRVTFKKLNDEFAVTLTPAGIETIDGQSTYILTADYQAITIISNGSNWYIENENSAGVFPTGWIHYTYATTPPAGWIYLNDGSIGSASSGATLRANADTLNLFTLLWNNVSNAYAPVSGGRGASAAADFAANKTLTLPPTEGRVLGVAGAGSGLTPRPLGAYVGEETHTLITSEMPSHTHGTFYTTSQSGGGAAIDVVVGAGSTTATSSTGGDGAHNNMQPTAFINAYIKL